jgi:cystathionine gamma-synthase
MKPHPIHENPICQAEQVGNPIPASLHAVSMCLPRWEDVLGYEERDPTTLHQLQLGYPRFLIHPYVLELATQLNPDPDRLALPFPSKATAERHATFIRRAHPHAPVDLFTTPQLDLVLYPADTEATARKAWQLFGEGLSSRQAEALLNQEAAKDPAPYAASIKEQLATYTQTDPEDIILFPSGMAALYAAKRAFQAIHPQKGFAQFGFPYGDTLKLLEEESDAPTQFYAYGDDQDLKHLKADLQREPIAGLFTEFPSNPLLQCVDLDGIRALADAHSFPLLIDETLGACVNLDTHAISDISAISLTKYFSGQGDAMGGALLINPNRPYASALKAFLHPAAQECPCFVGDLSRLSEGAQDLPERMEIINKNTQKLVDFLEQHPAIEELWHPSITDPERYERFSRQAGAYGGVLSFTLNFPEENTIPFYDRFACSKGPNLGTTYSLCCPFVMLAHYHELDWAEEAGASRWLLRLSVGTEPVETLIARFEDALR